MASNAERLLLAEQAAAFANSPVYQTMRERAEADVVERWKHAPTTEDRERCHAALLGLEALDAQLLALVNDGEMAKRDEQRGRA
jgi:hypothetical protein